MPTLTANGIRIAFDTAGDPKSVPVLLVHGLGMQLTAWPDEFIDGLAELGFYVIRFDHRDCGLSTKFEHAGTPSLKLAWLKSRVGWPLAVRRSGSTTREPARTCAAPLPSCRWSPTPSTRARAPTWCSS